MALIPINEAHALQIQAGTLGRKAGHLFEDHITSEINKLTYPYRVPRSRPPHLCMGDPALLLLDYIANNEGITSIKSAAAISTGALATSEAGKQWLSINGANVSRCKSDLVITLISEDGRTITTGISIKQCNNRTPTNAQLFFTTAIGFSNLLRSNGIPVSDDAVCALRQFCGDPGFQPLDDGNDRSRLSDPRRYFWEEIDPQGRLEWQNILTREQNTVSRLLFQKAYLDDPFTPDYLLHKTKASNSWNETEVAIYSIDELVSLSHAYGGFRTRAYSVRKGSYKDPVGIEHQAPRFGIIQMQRGGQAQHPQQLQFNLEAAYFYKI